MYLRRLYPLLRTSQRHLLRSEDFLRKYQICLRQLYFNSNQESIPSVLRCVQSLTLHRELSTTAHQAVDTNSTTTTEQEVFVDGENVSEPCQEFSEIKLEAYLLQELQKLGFKKPTTIQSYCLPVALSGRDIVGIGQTGSGKTLAFLIPALVHISKQNSIRRGDGPTVLILAPTRELAQQISGVVSKFRDICQIRNICVFGGVSKGPQMKYLSDGVNICVATPGRLLDLLEMGATNLSQVSYLVLDEADRMLDMGFEPQIRSIVNQIKQKHQTLMWSATWPPEVKGLARDFLNNFIQITVGSTELMANPNITQTIHICDQMEKQEKLLTLLTEILSEKRSKVLIFAETKLQVDALTRNLVWKKIPTSSIHGDKSQLQRDKAIYEFRTGQTNILIATDVAARGLDITDITHVINYDFPHVIDTYVHRIGRTARAHRKGSAHSFFTPDSRNQAQGLVDVLKKCNQNISPDLLEMALSCGPQKRSSLSNYYGRSTDNTSWKSRSSHQRNNFRQHPSRDRITDYNERERSGFFKQ